MKLRNFLIFCSLVFSAMLIMIFILTEFHSRLCVIPTYIGLLAVACIQVSLGWVFLGLPEILEEV